MWFCRSGFACYFAYSFSKTAVSLYVSTAHRQHSTQLPLLESHRPTSMASIATCVTRPTATCRPAPAAVATARPLFLLLQPRLQRPASRSRRRAPACRCQHTFVLYTKPECPLCDGLKVRVRVKGCSNSLIKAANVHQLPPTQLPHACSGKLGSSHPVSVASTHASALPGCRTSCKP